MIASCQKKLEAQLQKLLSTTVEKNISEGYLLLNDGNNLKDASQMYIALANSQATVSASLSIIPPPFSYLTLIPELYLVFKGQLKLISDMGFAMGKGIKLNKDVVIHIFVSSLGNSSLDQLSNKSTKLLIGQLNTLMLPQVTTFIAQKIVAQFAKSMISKSIPALGGSFMSMWVRQTTMNIGKYAEAIYMKDFDMGQHDYQLPIESETSSDQKVIGENKALGNASAEDIEVEKLRIFINLMLLDGKRDDREFCHILHLIKYADISEERKKMLYQCMLHSSIMNIDYALLKQVDDKNILLLDLLSLAKIDKSTHPIELTYIAKVAQELQIPYDVIDILN